MLVHHTERGMVLGLLVIVLAVLAACGSTAPVAPEDTTGAGGQPADTAAPTASTAPAAPAASSGAVVQSTRVPTPTTNPTVAPPDVQEAVGELNIAYSQLGPAKFIPKVNGSPQATINISTVWESMWHTDNKGNLIPRLVKDWDISSDGLVWTLKLQEGVPFHNGKGEMTAEDIIWSMDNVVSEGTVSGRLTQRQTIFYAEGGGMTAIDDHTLEVDTTGSGPRFDLTWYSSSALLTGALPIMSKAHVEAIGEERAAVEDPIGTGPWQSVEHKGSEVWRLEAVQDHWRKTPNFAQLNIWEIAEESTRIANFQAGKLDSMHMSLESIPVIQKVEGVKFLKLPGGGQTHINIHGQMYVDRDDLATPRNSELPWISSNPDTSSPEWEQARKVREAMNIALDRELIVETLLSGTGEPNHVFGWMGHEARLGSLKDELVYEYDPERAKQLLTEAGYPEGLEISMALTTRPFAGTVQMGEIACTMWEEIGVRCTQTRSQMSAFRPKFVDRSWEGVNTHGLGPLPEPLVTYSSSMVSAGVINYGVEHPFLEEKIAQAMTTFDDAERFSVQGEIAKWVFDNAVIIPMYKVDWVFPIGPRIDVWEMSCCDARTLFDLEHIPHRK